MANELKPIDEQFRHDCQAAWDHFGSEGRRVFAFAHRQFRAPGNTKFSVQSENYPKNGLTFLGMAAMMDPPRFLFWVNYMRDKNGFKKRNGRCNSTM